MPFIMAGDPDLKTTGEILLKLQEEGADLIELGIPYSDPLADGPVIQASASRALKSGTNPIKVLEMLSSLKGKLSIPIILFTYTNPLLNIGMDNFCQKASESGASGLVVPDLPLEEAEKLSYKADNHKLDLILLVAPTTPIERMKIICSKTKGFTYLVSVTGVTGARKEISANVESLIKILKDSSTMPIAVGFGVSDADQVRQIKKWGADGIIVGSAIVKRIAEAENKSCVEVAGNFCKRLREATL